MSRLRRVDCASPGITRRRRGRGFEYLDESTGERIEDEDVVERIETLAIPPAWEDVWVCADPWATSRRPVSTPGGASSTATTTSGASGATAEKFDDDARLRAGAARTARPGASATSAGARSPASGCSPAPCGCSTAASSGSAPRTTPRRTRPTGSRRCGSATSPSTATRSSSTTRPRAASGAFRRSPTGRSRGWSRRSQRAEGRGPRAARLSQRRRVARHPLDRDQRVHQGGDRRGAQRQGLPHLERDGARGGGARRLGAGARHEHEGRPQPSQAGRGQAGGALPRQHAGRLPRLLHRPAGLRPLRRRPHRRRACSSGFPRIPPTGRRFRGRSRRPCSTSSTGVSHLPSSGCARWNAREDALCLLVSGAPRPAPMMMPSGPRTKQYR